MLYYLFGGKAFKLVLPAGCMSLIAKKCDFPHLLVSSKDDAFYFQMNHTKTQEKELLGIKSYSLIFFFFFTRVLLLSEVWSNFFFVYPPCLTDFLLYCSARQNPYLSLTRFSTACIIQNPKCPQWNWDFLAFLVGMLKEEGGFCGIPEG